MPHKAAGASQAGPPAPAGGIVVVLALPGELGTGRSVTRAVAHVQEALKGTEDDFSVRRPCEGDVRLFDEIEEGVVPGVHLDDAPASGKRLGKARDLRHHAPAPNRRGRRTRL